MRPRYASSLKAPMPKRTAVDRRARVQRRKVQSTASGPESAHPPTWIESQLTRLADEAPEGKDWLHEIKYDGYRMHARIDGDKIQLLTRTGLDWSHRYKRTIEALRSLKVKSAYFDGELCALNADGLPVFSQLQAAMDEGRTDELVFLAFDLLYLNCESTAQLPLIERKERLERLSTRRPRGTASMSLLTVLAFASAPASWDSKASSQSGSTGRTLPKRSGRGSAVHRGATSVRSNKGLCSGNAARYSYGRRLCLSVC
jgi:ATP-dependent DNA ligase